MLKVIDHPLIKHKLTVMRKKETGTKDFRQNLDEIGGLMVYEITRDLPLKPIEIETPICQYTGYELAKKVVIVPILRAGLGMVNGIQDLIPTAKIAHVGMYRDEETLEPHTYFEKYPKNLEEAITIVVDPMLATGGSSVAAIDMVKKQGATNVKLVCLVGAPEGVKTVEKAHPDVMNILMQILDEGKIDDAQGRTVSFENTVICMTSNAGSTDKSIGVGFNKTENEISKEKAIKGLREFLRPEFISRIDEIVVFQDLSLESYQKIAALMLDEMKAPLEEKEIQLQYDEAALQAIAKKAYGKRYGARDIRRVIRQDVEDAVANLIIERIGMIQTISLTADASGTIQVSAL